MATFVLIHGGGHGGWCWRPVARRLRTAGHEVYAPTLTGLGERRHLLDPDVTLETHVADVTSLLFHEDVADATLVGHSYGGMVVTGAADQAPDRIARLVYLDAAIPTDGESLLDISPGLKMFDDVEIVNGVPLGLWPEAVAGPLYGLEGPQLSWAMPRLSPHPWATFEARLELADPERLRAIPRAIVNCRSSLARRRPEILDRWHDGDFVREVDAAHDLMLTASDLVSDMLLEIAMLENRA